MHTFFVSLKLLSLFSAPSAPQLVAVPLVPLVVLKMAQWWNQVVHDAAAPEDRDADPRGTQAPPMTLGVLPKTYTTLGYLKAVDHQDWRLYELQYLQFIKSMQQAFVYGGFLQILM